MAEREYISEMKNAIETAAELNLSKSARLLWLILINKNNAEYWREWFPASLGLLEKYTGMKRETVIRARAELLTSGILGYKTQGRKTTLYKLKKPLQK